LDSSSLVLALSSLFLDSVGLIAFFVVVVGLI
jgi:hypothetical protein